MAAGPGLRKAARSSPAAAPGLSSCAPRLPPRLPRGPAPGSSHGPLPRPVAAGLPHVTREQLRPESLGPARGGPSPPPGQGHVAPTRKKAPTPANGEPKGQDLGAPGAPLWRPASVPPRGRRAGRSAAWVTLVQRSGRATRPRRVPPSGGGLTRSALRTPGQLLHRL